MLAVFLDLPVEELTLIFQVLVLVGPIVAGLVYLAVPRPARPARPRRCPGAVAWSRGGPRAAGSEAGREPAGQGGFEEVEA